MTQNKWISTVRKNDYSVIIRDIETKDRIAFVYRQDGDPRGTINKNSYLIQAAPELLDALRDYVNDDFAGAPHRKRAVEAIKRAEGRCAADELIRSELERQRSIFNLDSKS